MTTLSLLPPLQITGCAGAAETSSALKFSKFLEGINYDPLSLKALIYFGQGPSVADHPILSIPILQLRKSLVSSATDAYKKKWCVAVLRNVNKEPTALGKGIFHAYLPWMVSCGSIFSWPLILQSLRSQ